MYIFKVTDSLVNFHLGSLLGFDQLSDILGVNHFCSSDTDFDRSSDQILFREGNHWLETGIIKIVKRSQNLSTSSFSPIFDKRAVIALVHHFITDRKRQSEREWIALVHLGLLQLLSANF